MIIKFQKKILKKKKDERISDYQKKRAIRHLVSQAELISLAPRAG